MNIKLFWKKLINPYNFKFLNPSDYYLELFYEDLIAIDQKMCFEHDHGFINYVLFYNEHTDDELRMFRDCFESMGFEVTTKMYKHRNKQGIIYTIDIPDFWHIGGMEE